MLMPTALLVDHEPDALKCLENHLHRLCPHVQVIGKANTLSEARALMRRRCPQLVFMELDTAPAEGYTFLHELNPANTQAILVTRQAEGARKALDMGCRGYLSKPIGAEALIMSVNLSLEWLALQRRQQQLMEENRAYKRLIDTSLHKHDPKQELLGIPTMKGMDFLEVQQIIRCEGLQRCTRVVTRSCSSIVSSYNLGEFRKMLQPHGFFSPHKSHLINLRYVRQYAREGVIVMVDQSRVPVSRRKKTEFLDYLPHL